MPTAVSERERQRLKSEKYRQADRAMSLYAVVSPARRAECEANDPLWLRTYCPDVFYNPFTPHQLKIISDCGESLRYGTQKCKAAPRGDGKSSIVKYLALKYALCRQVRFPLLIAATGEKAKKALNSMKRRLSGGAYLNAKTKMFSPRTAIGEDYPLECCAACYVDPWPSRARNVVMDGKPVHVEWSANSFIMPTFEDEEPLGPILLALGVTSDELQGCNIYDQRPDFVMLDDLDSRDSLASEDGVVAEKIEETVDKTVAGLGGQSRRLGQFMLCTITSRDSAAFKYSSPAAKPAWSGERIAAISAWPERKDLWETYIELRQAGKNVIDADGKPQDVFGREAHRFHLANREEMDRGAVLSNPHNFEADVLPDGTQKQVSSLQRCYDYIADHGMDSFLTEHQNDPPEDSGLVESGISVGLVQRQLSDIDQGVIPDGCTVLTHGVDVGKWWLHWVVRAWKQVDGGWNGYTIDYGRQNVYGTKANSEEGLDRAIHREILRRVTEFREMAYSQQIRDSMTLVDAGYRTDAVYSACLEAGLGVMPVKGFGLSVADSGLRMKFNDVMRRTKDRQPICDGAFYSTHRMPGMPTFKLVCASADQWKAWEHDRWMTARDKPGCLFLYGEPSNDPKRLSPDERDHGHYAHHICAEVEVEEEKDGAMRRRWKAKSKENHWLDASYYADVAAAIKGVRVLGSPVAAKADRPRLTFQQIQALAGGAK